MINRIKGILNMFPKNEDGTEKPQNSPYILLVKALNEMGNHEYDQPEINAAMESLNELYKGSAYKLAGFQLKMHSVINENTTKLNEAVSEIRMAKISMKAIQNILKDLDK
jgi:hypothetical protein